MYDFWRRFNSFCYDFIGYVLYFYILLLFYGSLHLIYVTSAMFLRNSKIWTYIYKSWFKKLVAMSSTRRLIEAGKEHTQGSVIWRCTHSWGGLIQSLAVEVKLVLRRNHEKLVNLLQDWHWFKNLIFVIWHWILIPFLEPFSIALEFRIHT